MPHRMLVKKMVEANKSAFDSSFSAMVMLQDQSEKVMNSFLVEATWLPEEARKVLGEWIDACKKGRDEYKKRMDEGYAKVASYLESAGEQAFRQIKERAD